MEERRDEQLAQRRAVPLLAVLALDGTILSTEPSLHEFLAGFASLTFQERRRLPRPIDEAVRGVLAARSSSGTQPPIALCCPVPELIVRMAFLEGPDGSCIAVSFERFQMRSGVRETAAQFGLSAREAQIGELLVQGFTAARIGARLNISRNTVREHVKHIHTKLGVRSRAQLVSRLLNLSGA